MVWVWLNQFWPFQIFMYWNNHILLYWKPFGFSLKNSRELASSIAPKSGSIRNTHSSQILRLYNPGNKMTPIFLKSLCGSSDLVKGGCYLLSFSSSGTARHGREWKNWTSRAGTSPSVHGCLGPLFSPLWSTVL